MRETFVDEVVVEVRSGAGGRGCVGFRREKYVPRGGPNGGDGGRGGDVIVVAEPQRSTLLDYRFNRRHLAQNGIPGGGAQCTGADGAPSILRVPVGTQLFNAETGELIVDLDKPGQQHTVLVGGRGGRGNEFFKTSVRQAPDFAQPGEPGQALTLKLELKLLADVGIVGMPNVGKSALIANISASRPKVANYPFTTLVPNLGVVQFGDHAHFVVADVPGLIVGASHGAGLGAQFLRHVERVRVLLHVVTAETGLPDRGPEDDFVAIDAEMRQYNAALGDVPQILVLNQIDRPEVAEHQEALAAFAKARGLAFFAISAATGEGVRALVNHVGHAVDQVRLAGIATAAVVAQQAAQAPAKPAVPLAKPLDGTYADALG